MAIKITFKRHAKTGQYKSFQRTYTDVKVKRKLIGSITEQKDGSFRCSIMIKQPVTQEDPAGWRWVRLNAVHRTEQSAREFLTLRADDLYAKYEIHELEPDQ